MHIGLVERYAIHIDPAVNQAKLVAWNANDSLDEMDAGIDGIVKHDDVAAANWPVRNDLVPEAVLTEVEFVDEQIVANQQCILHRLGGNLKRLHNEGHHENRDYEGAGKRLDHLTPRRGRMGMLRLALGHACSPPVTRESRYSSTCRAASCSAFFLVDPSALAVYSTSPFEPVSNRASMVKVLRCSGPDSFTRA